MITAGNNGWSSDNVRPDWGLDWSNSRLASYVDQSHSATSKHVAIISSPDNMLDIICSTDSETFLAGN